MFLRQLTFALIFFQFIISCSSEGKNDNIESSLEQNNVTENLTQDNYIKPGTTGVFTFKPSGALSGKSINVYYHAPQGDLTSFPILFSLLSSKDLLVLLSLSLTELLSSSNILPIKLLLVGIIDVGLIDSG